MSKNKSSHHWGHFLAVAAVLVVIAALLFVRFYWHQRTTSNIYSAYLDSHWAHDAGNFDAGAGPAATNVGLFATDAQRATLAAAADEGMCWAGRHYTAVNVWLVILMILLVLLMFYHFGTHKYTSSA